MMSFKGACLLVVLLIIVPVAAVVLVIADSIAPPRDHAHAEELQRLVGGLGCGPAVDLSRCAFSFDPRLCATCSLNHGPVPGGVYFCPQHACSILYCRPPTLSLAPPVAEEGDGRTP
jgi:hypothetical protein